MTKYFKHVDDEEKNSSNPDGIKYYAPEGTPHINIPPDPDNMDYVRMMKEVDAGTSTIVEVNDTFVRTYADNRRNAYPAIGDQLDDLYRKGAFSDDMAAAIKAVKAAWPKPKEVK